MNLLIRKTLAKINKSVNRFLDPNPFFDQILLVIGIFRLGFIMFFPWGKTERMKKYYAKMLAFMIEETSMKFKKPFNIFQYIEDKYFIRLRGKFQSGKKITDDEFKSFILKDMAGIKDTDIYIKSTAIKNIKEILLSKELVEEGVLKLGALN